MAGSRGFRSRGSPPIQARRFESIQEVDQAIAKVKRRLDEVRGIAAAKVRYDDPKVTAAQSNLRHMIRDVFGEHSPEYLEHGHHEISAGRLLYAMGESPSRDERQQDFAEGLPITTAMLENLVRRLEEQKADLGGDPSNRARATFEGLDLDPRVADVSADLYRDGHYAQAVFDASKALVNLVKEKSRRHDLDGAGLMRTVFSVNAPILAFNDLVAQSDKDEQEGMMHLFEGAVLALRNPRGHAFRTDSPEEALDYIALLACSRSAWTGRADESPDGHRPDRAHFAQSLPVVSTGTLENG
jgi:uncharacterized protein (TIGR02391 family)